MPTGSSEFLTVSIESVLVEKVEGSSPVAKRLWRDVLSRDNALEILDNNAGGMSDPFDSTLSKALIIEDTTASSAERRGYSNNDTNTTLVHISKPFWVKRVKSVIILATVVARLARTEVVTSCEYNDWNRAEHSDSLSILAAVRVEMDCEQSLPKVLALQLQRA